MPGEKILFVDDEEQIRKLLATFLQRKGYDVVTASDGLEALRALRDMTPSLVITDVNMPYVNGLELTKRLRENHKTARIPIVMLSARKQADEVLAGYAVGADEYVPKPIEMAVLAAKIETLLRRARETTAPEGGKQGHRAKIVLFLHGKGGTGATTLAVNAAVALATTKAFRVAFLDLNTEFPTAPLFFDVRPERSLAELRATSVEELDDDQFSRFTVKHQSGVRLLVASDAPEKAELVTITAVQHSLDRIARETDYVVIDTPSSFNQIDLAALDVADLVCVVTSPLVASVKATRDSLDVLDKLKYPADRVLLVLNRTTTRGLEFDQVAKFFGRKPDLVVPHTPIFDDAADQGRPLVTASPDSSGAAVMRDLASKIAAVIPVGV